MKTKVDRCVFRTTKTGGVAAMRGVGFASIAHEAPEDMRLGLFKDATLSRDEALAFADWIKVTLGAKP